MAKKKQKTKGKQVNKPATIENLSDAVIAAAYSTATTSVVLPVFLKVCRLCESKDGPFLNIFDADKVIAKNIDELMPFSVTENDDLPHKICFRCSVKLEELHNFIQRCIKTQENLREMIGNNAPAATKSKMAKKLWEEKLNKSNMSNDDICNALIEKAMEGIKHIPALPVDNKSSLETKRVTRSRESKKDVKTEPTSDNNDEVSLKQIKMANEKFDSNTSSSKVMKSKPDAQNKKPDEKQTKKPPTQVKKADIHSKKKEEVPQTSSYTQNENKSAEKAKNTSLNNLSFDYEVPVINPIKESENEEEKREEPKKTFNIMDHISMIKVNGVGILFQCKLCNRNFLKKEVVESHNCAKNGIPKVDVPKCSPAPEPPKVSSVKYIKIDSDMKKTLTEKIKRAEKSENERIAAIENVKAQEEINEPPPIIRPKPKAGPASKTRRNVIDLDSSASQSSSDSTIISPPALSVPPTVNFPSMPNLNSRFKLVPGPNNIFTLVEVKSTLNSQTSTEIPKKPSKKRKSDEVVTGVDLPVIHEKPEIPELINLNNTLKPYPVGLFQTVGHSAGLYEPPVTSAPSTFTTPAMKKQSYTIVQTGNPSKLLISTKAKAVETEEAPRKRPRKSKLEVRHSTEPKEPYSVTLEDVAPPKDSGFFTFINVDPLLQPSYVLPTDNIIQESQISTSSAVVRPPIENKETGNEKYSCNLCGENFTREKKLLTHIQSHYMKMDEEDQLRVEKGSKKRARK